MKCFIVSIGLCIALVGCSSDFPEIPGQTLPPSAVGSDGSAEQQINAIRAQANLSPLKRNSTLDTVAEAHSRDMAANEFLGHTGSNGSTVGQRVDVTGYDWCLVAENVSRGYSSEASAIEGWRNSPTHYANLTKENATEYGLADVDGYRTMVIAGKCR